MYIYIYVYVYVYVYDCICVCMCVYIYIYTYNYHSCVGFTSQLMQVRIPWSSHHLTPPAARAQSALQSGRGTLPFTSERSSEGS